LAQQVFQGGILPAQEGKGEAKRWWGEGEAEILKTTF
jgi:hypothetical protein